MNKEDLKLISVLMFIAVCVSVLVSGAIVDESMLAIERLSVLGDIMPIGCIITLVVSVMVMSWSD